MQFRLLTQSDFIYFFFNIMNKNKPSGSQYRKRRLEKDEAVRQNTRDISPYFQKKGNSTKHFMIHALCGIHIKNEILVPVSIDENTFVENANENSQGNTNLDVDNNASKKQKSQCLSEGIDLHLCSISIFVK